MVLLGENIYNKNCLSCHGPKGQGLAKDWKVKDENGNYPAPPLNGTAHTWHHSPEQLLYTINKGGVEMGGQMPAFEKRLTEEEKKALIEYIYRVICSTNNYICSSLSKYSIFHNTWNIINLSFQFIRNFYRKIMYIHNLISII